MQKCLTVVMALIGLMGTVVVAAAQSAHTPEQAKALVDRATTYMKSEGKEKALAAFNDPKGDFVDGDLYLFVLDAGDGKLTMLAHGVNKALVGKPQIDVKDAEGKPFNRDMFTMVSTAGEGWVTYNWPNPATKKIASKTSFCRKIDDVIIGAGVYN